MLFNPCCSGVMYVTHSLRNISLAWKSENEDSTFEFERKRNRPERYDRNLAERHHKNSLIKAPSVLQQSENRMEE
ncbi:hypothetical protein Lal_00029166 [Lupinus albus]|nr:hypothetical protein Lal_00029166 [Lupinus albus]